MFKIPLSRIFKFLPDKIKNIHIPTPELYHPPSPTRIRNSKRGSGRQGKSRTKPEQSTWYSQLTTKQRECYHIIRKFTNWQLTQWNRAGCPGIDDPSKLQSFARRKA